MILHPAVAGGALRVVNFHLVVLLAIGYAVIGNMVVDYRERIGDAALTIQVCVVMQVISATIMTEYALVVNG